MNALKNTKEDKEPIKPSILIHRERVIKSGATIRSIVLCKSVREKYFDQTIKSGDINKLIVPFYNKNVRLDGTHSYFSVAKEGDVVISYYVGGRFPYGVSNVVRKPEDEIKTPLDPKSSHIPAKLERDQYLPEWLMVAILNNKEIQSCFIDDNWEPSKSFLINGMTIKDYHKSKNAEEDQPKRKHKKPFSKNKRFFANKRSKAKE